MIPWYPHVTVASVIERQGRFLLVEEQADEGRVFNQPAGHLEAGESLAEAAARLRKSAAARELFGDAFVDHYAYTREWEDSEQRKAVTDWQLQRYFEII